MIKILIKSMYLLTEVTEFKRGKDKKKRKIRNNIVPKRNLGEKIVKYNGVKYKLSASKPSTAKNKKRYRLVTNLSTGKTKKINYGYKPMDNFGNGHRSLKRRNNYLTRSAGIKDKSGNLTKDNPMSPNFHSRSDLW